VPRHDGKTDSLGLIVLDEPCAKQSDPHVLDLKLRSLTKQTTTKQMVSNEFSLHTTKQMVSNEFSLHHRHHLSAIRIFILPIK